jgi:hypothetical protein
LHIEPVGLDDRCPEVQRRTAHWVNADRQAGCCDRLHVDHAAKIGHIRRDKIDHVGGFCLECSRQRHAPDFLQPAGQQMIGTILNLFGGLGIGWAA